VTTPGRGPGLGRAVGALVVWGLAQVVPFVPSRLPPSVTHFAPLLPPLAGLAFAVALAAAFVWRFAVRGGAHAEYRRDTFRLRGVSSRVARRLPVVAVLLMVMVVASLVLVPRIVPVPPDKTTILDAYARLPHGTLTILATVAILAPLFEEFLFRGWVQTRLERRVAPANAILVAAAIFAAMHGELFGFPTRLLFGVVAGHLAWSTRSIWPGVVLHAFYNATLFVGGTGGARDVSARDLTRWAHTPFIFWPAALAFLAAGLLLVVALRGVAGAAAEDGAG
jgi:hypothetical protein